MSDFKPGDRVRRINKDFGMHRVGREFIVADSSHYNLYVEGDHRGYAPENYRLIKKGTVDDIDYNDQGWKVGDRAYISGEPTGGGTLSRGDIVKVTSIDVGGEPCYGISGLPLNRNNCKPLRILQDEEEIEEGQRHLLINARTGTIKDRSCLYMQAMAPHSTSVYCIVPEPPKPDPEQERKAKLLADIEEMKAKLAEMEKEAQS